MTAVLELRGASKTFGSGPTAVHALRDVDLAVAAGELVAVMGPSGSGKSSLLTIAGGLEDATTGEVLIDGTPLSTMGPSARARLRRTSIGFVFQDFNLLPGLTAAENVSLPLELDGTPARSANWRWLRPAFVRMSRNRAPTSKSIGRSFPVAGEPMRIRACDQYSNSTCSK